MHWGLRAAGTARCSPRAPGPAERSTLASGPRRKPWPRGAGAGRLHGASGRLRETEGCCGGPQNLEDRLARAPEQRPGVGERERRAAGVGSAAAAGAEPRGQAPAAAGPRAAAAPGARPGQAGGAQRGGLWAADSRLLQVLERLRIARNRHCRVHPLEPPPSPAQLPPQARPLGEGGGATTTLQGRGPVAKLGATWIALTGLYPALAITPAEWADPPEHRGCCPLLAASSPGGREAPAGAQRSVPPQEDAAGRRRAVREQLEQTHRERTGRLRALGARNTQNFQQLLWPLGAAEPDEHRSPFRGPSKSLMNPQGDD
ncbi:uncharacterized protein [Bos mutus]|uniref:uncharacterized protein n=1 Tax=Bos mutus TaxID=72004 RepID=UPI0038B687DA